MIVTPIAFKANTAPFERPKTRIWANVSRGSWRETGAETGGGVSAPCFVAVQSISKARLHSGRRVIKFPFKCPETIESFWNEADKSKSRPKDAVKASFTMCGRSVGSNIV